MSSRVQKAWDRVISEKAESEVRKWAASNAYTLCFVAFMFIATWMMIIIAAIWEARQ